MDSPRLAVGRSLEGGRCHESGDSLGLMSRSEAISANGYDAEDVDREIAADNARADAFGLVFDSDPRHELPTPAPVVQPPDSQPQGN